MWLEERHGTSVKSFAWHKRKRGSPREEMMKSVAKWLNKATNVTRNAEGNSRKRDVEENGRRPGEKALHLMTMT